MRALTDALWALLESKLQAGPDGGHRARLEIGPLVPAAPPPPEPPPVPEYGYGTFDVLYGPSPTTDATIIWAGYVTVGGTITLAWNDANAKMYKGIAATTSHPAFAVGSFGQKLTAPWADPDVFPSASELLAAGDQGYEQPWPTVGGQTYHTYGPTVGWVPMLTSGSENFPNSGVDFVVDAGFWCLLWVSSQRNGTFPGDPQGAPGVNGLDLIFTISGTATLAETDPGDPGTAGAWTQYPVSAATVDKSYGADADAMTCTLENPTGLIVPLAAEPAIDIEQRVRLYQWYGAPENAVLTFEGLVDVVQARRHPSKVTIRAKDRMKLLLNESIIVLDPQDVDDEDAVRTPDNYVWVGYQALDIVNDLLDKAGWAADKRSMTDTNYTVDEFTASLGDSHAGAIRRIANLIVYEPWVDEDGVFQFHPRPSILVGEGDDEVEAVASFSGAREVYVLDAGLDDQGLKTRVFAFGPEGEEAVETWDAVWHTNASKHPNGLWHRPTEPTKLYVINGKTRKIYRLDQVTKVLTTLSGVLSTHALTGGMDGNDPTNETFVWVLETPFNDDDIGLPPSGANCKVLKVQTSDWTVVDEFTLGAGIYTSIRVTAGFIYITRLDNQTIKKFNKTTLTLDSTIDVSAFGDPTGLAIDGTDLWIFAGGEIHVVAESAPTVEIATHPLPGNVGGGEIDSVDNSYVYVALPSMGLIYKYQTLIPGTAAISGQAIDYDLEDALGNKADVEPRDHVGCPNDEDPHPFEIRLEVVTDDKLVSSTQAQDTAARTLAKLSRKRRYIQVGIIANPGIQKGDPVEIHDPPSGLDHALVMVETYNTNQRGNKYTGVISGPLWEPEY